MATHVEIRDVDNYVLAVDHDDLSRWTSDGYVLADRAQVFLAIDRALRRIDEDDLATIWAALSGPPLPLRNTRQELEELVHEAALRVAPRVQLLVREFKRGWAGAPMQQPKSAGTPRLDTEHYIVIQSVDRDDKPAPGVQLEVLIAGGEVKGATTGQDGFARIERIHAGSVTVRVLNVDGSMWRPLDGAASRPSSTDERVHAHVVSQGECLSKIAHRYGLESWKRVWEHPKNAPLRKKRKSPHVLHPDDHVVVPGIDVHEIVRPTDATHRIQVETKGEIELELILEGRATEPLAGHACVVRYDGPRGPVELADLTLDGDGRLRVILPVQVRTLELEVVELETTLSLAVAELDPVSEADSKEPLLSGVEQRLWSLGYGGPPRGRLDDACCAAIAAFQRNELGRAEASGEPDAETCSALERAYGA